MLYLDLPVCVGHQRCDKNFCIDGILGENSNREMQPVTVHALKMEIEDGVGGVAEMAYLGIEDRENSISTYPTGRQENTIRCRY